ncbi:hypothetical protein [Streptomyces sp. NPDC003877]
MHRRGAAAAHRTAAADLVCDFAEALGRPCAAGTATAVLGERLHRVADLTGVDPGSAHGVRTLGAVVTRRLSGA